MKDLRPIFIRLLQTMCLSFVVSTSILSEVSPPVPKGIKPALAAKAAPIVSSPEVSESKAAAVMPAHPNTKVATTSKTSVIKSPLQLNIKNNGTLKAHLTGFTVTYADATTGEPATIAAKTDMHIDSNHTKSIGFKVKIPNTGSAPKFNPFVSDIEINGKSISTGYKAIPLTPNEQSYTLALLQVTQKNGTWVRDVKAMKKADSAIPIPTIAPDKSKSRITPIKKAVVAAVIEKNKKSKSKFKKSAKKVKKNKKSKSSQAVNHVLIH